MDEKRIPMSEIKRKPDPENLRPDFTLEEFLETVDFNLLRDIFNRIAKKSGLDPENLNFISREQIKASNHYESVFDHIFNEVRIGWAHRIEHRAPLRGLFMLEAVVHEMLHAATLHYSDETGNSVGYDHFKVNPETIGSGVSLGTRSFYLLNEAVTDFLGQEITAEYMKATAFYGSFSKFVKACMAQMVDKQFLEKPEISKLTEDELYNKFWEMFSGYRKPVFLLRKLVDLIALETGVDRQVIWNAIVRGMFEGEEFTDERLRSDLESVTYKDFVFDLQRLSNEQDIPEIITKVQRRLDKRKNGRI